MSSENDDLVKDQYGIRKRVSIVWRYFEKLNRFRVRCKICSHVQNYQGTTGNILRHLKSKHQIDATVKGQTASIDSTEDIMSSPELNVGKEELVETDEFNVIVKTEHNDVNIETIPRPVKQTTIEIITYTDDADIDPYAGESVVAFRDYIEPQNTQESCDKKSSVQPAKLKVVDVAEERILAEIEYFREKAAYYRIQRNLTALQAKKIRYELEQLG